MKKHRLIGRKVKLAKSAEDCGLSTYRQGEDIHQLGTVLTVTDVWDFCVFKVVCKPQGHIIPRYTYHHKQLRYLNNKEVKL